jgi:hypothetical protein
MKEDEECNLAQEEFRELKTKFIDLSEKYNALETQVHAQAIKTNALVQRVDHPSLV